MLMSPGSLPAKGIFEIKKIIAPRMAIPIPIKIIIFPRFEKFRFISNKFFNRYQDTQDAININIINYTLLPEI